MDLSVLQSIPSLKNQKMDRSSAFYYCFTHSNVGTNTQLVEKLKDFSSGAATRHPCGTRGSFSSVSGTSVKECVVSENHVTLLLEDGRLCRVRYREEQPSKEKSDDDGASTSSARSLGSRSTSPSEDRGPSSIVHAWGLLGSGQSGSGGGSGLRPARARIALLRRQGGRPLLSRWPIVPAAEVPDELVDQAMAVLQGKSREVVIRELQKTSLDVNQAVNNLLSRDDDDGGEGHEEAIPSFLPSGEELLSLLGSGLGSVAEEELEEAMGRVREEGGGRESRTGLYELSDPLLQSEIRTLVGLGEGGRSEGGRRQLRKRKESGPIPVLFDGEAEWCGGRKSGLRFRNIVGLYSELLAVDHCGRVYEWAWHSPFPLLCQEEELGLVGEHVRLIAGRVLRATVVTESGKIVSWLDRAVTSVAPHVEHRAVLFPELSGETVSRLHACELFSVVQTESGKLFWWGMLPFAERKQVIMQAQDRLRAVRYGSSAGREGVSEGSTVCLRSSPVYPVGCRAIHISGGHLQCGVLQESVFSSSLSEKCRFRVLSGEGEEMDTGRLLEEEPHLGSKRRLSEDVSGKGRVVEEFWCLRDVIFVDRLQSSRAGTVVKVDGYYAAVHFPPLEQEEVGSAALANCRLLRKDELILASEGLAQQAPSFSQESPKWLRAPACYHLLCSAGDSRGLHALYSAHSLVRYVLFNVHTGRVSQNAQCSEITSRHLLSQASLQLVPLTLSVWLVVDARGGLYPISKDIAGTMKDPPMLNLPPVTCVGVGACSNASTLVVLPYKSQSFMPSVLHCDLASIRAHVELLRADPSSLHMALTERCAGGCNILHVLASLGRPPDPSSPHKERRESAARTLPATLCTGLARQIIKFAATHASGGPASSATEWGGEEGEEGGDAPSVSDVVSSVEFLLQRPECQDTVAQLLGERSAEGYTPFMTAVTNKAYAVALRLFDFAQSVAGSLEESLMAMVYPPDSHPDDNPIFVVSRNDTCSFTWTGEEHIHQDIFECRTCGLTGSLCCCTECAYSCHRGHDCSFKRASPTAYCDCWERCKCRALAPGSDLLRQGLLQRLLKHTSLSTRVSACKEHLLGLLLRTVARQAREQSQWHALRSAFAHRVRPGKHEEMPAHDLAPPKFAQKALGMVLEDWRSVRAALMSGEGDWWGRFSGPTSSEVSQSTTWSLDALTHTLLSKHNQQTIESLLVTLVRHVGPSRENTEAVRVCERFLRSVVRVFAVCHLEAVRVPSSSLVSSNRRKSSQVLVEQVERVLLSLAPLAVPQAVSLAKAVILPVCGGVVRPTDPLCMSARHKTGEEVFRLPPLSLLRVPQTSEEEEDHTQGDGGSSDVESEGGDGEESTSGGPAHDASSTATIGSAPLYLSDQDSSEEDMDSAPEDGSLDGDSRHDVDLLTDHTPSHHDHAHSDSDTHWALPSSRHTHTSSRLSRSTAHRDHLSVGYSATLLAQTFSLVVRLVGNLVQGLWPVPTGDVPHTLPVLEGEIPTLKREVWGELWEVWEWLVYQMDVLESQLMVGRMLDGKVPSEADPRRRAGGEPTPEVLDSRKEFFSYLLTLMRGQHREHGGVMPAIDVGAMEHLAWCADALFALLQATTPMPPHTGMLPREEGNPLLHDDNRRFFARSPSVTCLGAIPLSPFDPIWLGLPLVEKPHTLEPSQSKMDWFGYQQGDLLCCWPSCGLPEPPILRLIQFPPSRTSYFMHSTWPKLPETLEAHKHKISRECLLEVDSHRLAASVLHGRWSLAIDLFGQVFMESVGAQPKSFLEEELTFTAKESRFRREMDHLRTTSHKELLLKVERRREKLLPQLFSQLNAYLDVRPVGASPPLCVHRVKVTFQEEPGEGSGVLRSLFTSFTEAVLSTEPLPSLEPLSSQKRHSPSPTMGEREKQASTISSNSRKSTSAPVLCCALPEDCPLFYQPGKPGTYAPCRGYNTPERLNAYRNVGRVIGLCLLLGEQLPLPLCRHVFKHLKMEEASWHDLAFFDPMMYESMRRMIADLEEEGGRDRLAGLGLSFVASLRPEEGGGSCSLANGDGSSIPVTPENVFTYVRRYAQLRMVKAHEQAMDQMCLGVYDVLPSLSLRDLSPEELRLLLCGCLQVDVEVLRAATVFEDESRKGEEVLGRFKTWFWAVVERMSQRERQDLLVFWTSTPSLPANMGSLQPPPSVTLRPADDQRLPTANTCISRLYLPLYSSKSLLRAKLLTAVKTRTFGFV